jgi:hypothetical protein
MLVSRRWAYTAFLWLTLATIFSNALAPSGSPLRPGSGSAFNPFTTDVSLGPKRGTKPVKDRQQHVTSEGDDRPAVAPANVVLTLAAFPLPTRIPSAGQPEPLLDPLVRPRPASRGFLARAPPFA